MKRIVSLIVMIPYLLISSWTIDNLEEKSDQTGVPCHYELIIDGLEAICSHRSLTSVPTNLTDDVTMLDLRNNRITKLTNGAFSGLSQLTYLSFDSNNMSIIESGAFQTLPNLLSISLAHNNLTSLPDDVFLRNQKLQVVDLSVNHFRNFPGNALNSLSTLQIVTLERNDVSSLNFTGFRSRNMTKLSLKYNNLSSLREDIFLPLVDARIDMLDLGQNKLKSLQNGLFRHLKRVRTLYVDFNNIQNFSIRTFVGMSSLDTLHAGCSNISAIIPLSSLPNQTNILPNLKYLSLQGNHIASIPSGAFWGLGNLITLDLHQCRIKTLQNNSFQGLKSLEVLNLMANYIYTVTNIMFSYSPRLRSLTLDRNHISALRPKQFGGLTSLVSLSLARCDKLDDVTPERGGWNMPNLKFLDISHGRLVRIKKYAFYGMTNMTTLNISYNQLTTIENGAFMSNDDLKTLILSDLSHLGQIFTPFENLHELTWLDMSRSSVALSHKLFSGLYSLERLYMRESALTADNFWDPHNKDLPVLSSLSTLERLYLRGNALDRLQPGVFRGLQSLEYLELISCDITYLDRDIFKNLTSLLYLYIDGNHIAELTSEHLSDLRSLIGVSIKNNEIKGLLPDVFKYNPSLSFLYISHNHLLTVQEGTVLPRQTLDISYNPLSCNCDFRWFVNWIREADVSIIRPDQTNCSAVSLSPFKNKPILAFNPTEECGPKIWVFVIAAFVITTCAMICIVAYQRRWLINYKFFHLKLVFVGRRGEHDGRERLDYEYDINLAFDDEDEDWVRETFKPGFEERLPDFDRIVCGDDDLPLGMFYIDAITEVIEQSYKSILIVSRRAVDNHSFINKLQLAVAHMNEVELEKTVLIFKGDIPDANLPYLVRLFLSKNKPYFRWSDDKYAQKLMWDKLKHELRYNKKMNDVLPV